MNEDTSLITSALSSVQTAITDAEHRYKRATGSVQLLAVSKRKPISAIKVAMAAGQLAFGENYVDEGVEKIVSINEPGLEWHFIGSIQSRKTAQIAEHFQWAHGIDRLKIARRLSEQRPEGKHPLNICIQVNLDNEPGKAGVSLAEVPELAQACEQLPGIRLRGLMAIPAPRDEFDDQRTVFASLRECLESLQANFAALDTLSIGMSADMEAAISEGATIVRVGTAIFGVRDT